MDSSGEMVQQIPDHASSSTVKFVVHVNGQLDCHFSPDVVTITTEPLETDVPALVA